ncbi:resuscitation-promoting factor [Sciscionella sediminilitoris]|uniref:resuscitation-promoting factor n=1 Tax=Sciscionella sediminilitoris TaxID=1445613 RepID=UPI000567254B|nr:resuscitation-promoting factor [Sciscionella sp. SE31]
MTASRRRSTLLLDSNPKLPAPRETEISGEWTTVWRGDLQATPAGSGSPFSVTTEDVMDVLGEDANDLLAASDLDMDELVGLLNAETMLLPRIDEQTEAEIEAALAGVSTADPEAEEGERKAEPRTALSPWRKRFLRATIGAVLLSAAGGGAAAATMNKTVNLNVDGKTKTVHTFADNVEGVLESEGLKAGPHDTLSPSPNASVSDGGTVTLDRGRQLSVTVDGVQQQHWVHAESVGQALQDLQINTNNAWISTRPDSQIPLGGQNIEVKTLKAIQILDGANKPRMVDTHAVTVGELLKSLNLPLGPKDTVSPGADVKLTNGSQVMISRSGVKVINQNEDIDPPVQKVDDDSMYEGEQKVTDPGTPGKQIVTYRITDVNGKETKREQLGVKKVSDPKPKVIHVGTKKKPEPSISNGALWDRIAQCESSGNWSANTGNGYYGGLQFNTPTWQSNGGGKYAPRADQASKAQQIDIANKVKAARGLQPWECAGKLGMD